MEPLTDFVLDTVALVRYLEDDLPRAADRAVREAESGRGRLYLPEIAMAEFAYIALRGRLRIPNPRAAVEEVLNEVRASAYLVLSSLSPGGWDVLLDLDIPELHDRMIASDAISRRLPLITNDPAFGSTPGLRVVWR